MAKQIIKITSLIVIFCSLNLLFTSCKEKSLDGLLVLTQIEENSQSKNSSIENLGRYLKKARIVAINSNEPNTSLQILSENFYSACAPKISYDGNSMLFAAQQEENDIWQIWEMNLKTLEANQITSSKENCIDPDYLPGNQIVYSKPVINATEKTGNALFTSSLNGTNESQITFNPHTYFAPTILKDGRIATISQQLYPNEKESVYTIMRPDGTKQELFYQSTPKNHINGRCWEDKNHQILFIESDNETKMGGNIVAINYNRPLHSKINLSSEIEGEFNSVFPLNNSKLLTTYRSSAKENFGIYEFDVENKALAKFIYKDDTYQTIEAIAVEKHQRPRKLPSEVNPEVKTALLVCQDINYQNFEDEENTNSLTKATQLEILGIDSSMGIMDAEEDGSFYIKIVADTPFRIQSLDEFGNIVSGPGSWLYLRPNERRGCVGCHQNNEMAPKNCQPLAVRKDPIVIPFQGNRIQPKNELKE